MKKIVTREFDKNIEYKLINEGSHPILAKCYAARGITSMDLLDHRLINMLSPNSLLNIHQAAEVILTTIAQKKKLLLLRTMIAMALLLVPLLLKV